MNTNLTFKQSFTARNSSGFMLMEILMALLALSFIIRPNFSQCEDDWGHRTTKVEWELPMAKLLAQVGDFEKLIDRSWAGLDAQFGYTGPSMGARASNLMKSSAQNGVVLMTAGFVDTQGNWTGNLSNNADHFETAAKGMVTAYYAAAQEGMRR